MNEIIISVILIGVLLLFLHPSDLLMPMTLEASLVILLVAAFLAFLGLVWKENVRDERDAYHRQHAGRMSFLAGAVILVAGIIVQNYFHNVDPWLVAALIIMIIVKILARLYSQNRK